MGFSSVCFEEHIDTIVGFSRPFRIFLSFSERGGNKINMVDENASIVQDNAVHAVSVKLPEFWTSMPDAWFIQIESQFVIRGITGEQTKFHYVVQVLPQDVVASVNDILIQQPQPINPYTNLKKVLIDRNSMSESKRIEALLSGKQMGHRKPSQFYWRLKSIAGQSVMASESLVLEL